MIVPATVLNIVYMSTDIRVFLLNSITGRTRVRPFDKLRAGCDVTV